ncbi:MAG: TlpA family protein disulfide reductase [Streptosporangiales bacterium]
MWRPHSNLAVLVAALCAAAVALTGCSGAGTSSGTKDSGQQRYVAGDGEVQAVPAGDRTKAPTLAGRSLTGKRVSSKAYKGKVLVVNFWASWCAPCRAEAPALRAVQKKTKAAGVRFLGVNFKDNKKNAAIFVDHFNLGYPSIFDQPGELALRFRGELPPAAVPSTIVIDRHGRVATRIIGETTYTKLLSVVRKVARR